MIDTQFVNQKKIIFPSNYNHPTMFLCFTIYFRKSVIFRVAWLLYLTLVYSLFSVLLLSTRSIYYFNLCMFLQTHILFYSISSAQIHSCSQYNISCYTVNTNGVHQTLEREIIVMESKYSLSEHFYFLL